ncbi:hypothetical protein [Streptomyces soliscabiei]|uniref:hypothetical protein n=1 Tax=Streptomyces soliscabiei TaxID=588897 RepID=UPI0029A4279C|nr:hypothetical protein [Streptomyces sp. NY05-11A]MDX2675814.1 hypothetical protein [Streptomyces sp. NY05-11A]
MSSTPEPLPTAAASSGREPSNVATAASVARQILTTYADVDHGDVHGLNRAHGAVTEALRILLRAVDPEGEATAASVARQVLTTYADVDHGDVFALNRAHGALTEALRILLRAVDPETEATPVSTAQRCAAAHPDDPTPCGGPAAVTVLDASNSGADGCEHHGARLLASIEGARVYPLPDAPQGAAVRVFKAADSTRPFCWYDAAPRTEPSQRSHAENRERGEAR